MCMLHRLTFRALSSCFAAAGDGDYTSFYTLKLKCRMGIHLRLATKRESDNANSIDYTLKRKCIISPSCTS